MAPADASSPSLRRQAKSRAALLAAYREGLGLAAIIATHESIAVRIAPMDEVQAGASRGQAGAAAARFWCRRAADAERVAKAAMARLRRRSSQDEAALPQPGAYAATANDWHGAIEGAAKRLRIALYSDADIHAEADAVIARVEAEIENLKRVGQLKSVNQSYRAYRLAASGRGERAAPYADWFNKYKADLVRELAAALRYA
jgi:hypothetical protein